MGECSRHLFRLLEDNTHDGPAAVHQPCSDVLPEGAAYAQVSSRATGRCPALLPSQGLERYPEVMTRPPDRDPLQEAEYLRRLTLGILSTLEHKGLLSMAEVNAILRAAQQAAVPAAPASAPGGTPQAPAILGTKWVKPGQPYQPIDESTPIVLPKVAQADAGAASSLAAAEPIPQPSTDEPGDKAPVPVFDIKME